jgi:phage gp36-like protein
VSQYATEQQFRDLGLSDGALEDVTSSVIDLHLEMASGLADSYISNRYAVPISPIPAVLTRAVVDIAVYEVLLRRGYNPETYDTNYRLRYEDALRWLQAIYNREADLPGVTESGGVEVPTGRASRVVTQPMRGWQQDD